VVLTEPPNASVVRGNGRMDGLIRMNAVENSTIVLTADNGQNSQKSLACYTMVRPSPYFNLIYADDQDRLKARNERMELGLAGRIWILAYVKFLDVFGTTRDVIVCLRVRPVGEGFERAGGEGCNTSQ
jgi:hypothetical protein